MACPIKIRAFSNDEKKLKLLYRWLFFTFGKKPNPNSPILAFIKRVTGISRFESIENIGNNIQAQGLDELVRDLISVIQSILFEVKYLLPKCTIENFKLRMICATSDAAQTAWLYGGVCAVVYPAIGIFFSNTKQKKDCADIQITCDFCTQKSEFSVDGTISCSAFLCLVAFLRLAWKDHKKQKDSNQDR